MATTEDSFRGAKLPWTNVVLLKVHTIIYHYHGPIIDCMKAGCFTWTKEAKKAFAEIKRRLTNAHILVLLNFNIAFKLHANASKVGIGAILSQEGQPVAFFSEKLYRGNMWYNIYDMEFYTILQGIRHWKHYLFQREFILYIDHHVLKHLSSQERYLQGMRSGLHNYCSLPLSLNINLEC